MATSYRGQGSGTLICLSGHVLGDCIPDGFVEETIRKLKPGVDTIVKISRRVVSSWEKTDLGPLLGPITMAQGAIVPNGAEASGAEVPIRSVSVIAKEVHTHWVQ